MIVVGLTGSIGMGKSVTARQLRRMGVPVHEADAAVHRLLGPGGAGVAAVARRFPQALKKNRIDRKALGAIVFADPSARRDLEAILHPLVRAESEEFLKRCRARRCPLAVLDVPLLFETRQQGRFDHILCVTAPYFVQKRRVISRPGMDESRLKAVLAIQLPDARKRRAADTVINTARGYRATRACIRKTIKELRRNGQASEHKKSLGHPPRHA